MRANDFIKTKILLGALLCLSLQGCKGEDEAIDTSDAVAQTSLEGGCRTFPSIIDAPLVVSVATENSYTATHRTCVSTSANLWIMNDGRKEVANSLNHTFEKAGEYAVEAIAYRGTDKIIDGQRKVIVKSCEDGSSCKAIHGADFANLNENINLNFATAGVGASDMIFSVKNSSGDVSELSSNVFSANQAGVFEISAESDGEVFKKKISVVDMPSDIVGVPACDLKELMLSGPSESKLNESSYAKVNLPSCLLNLISSIKWSFSDGQENTYSQSTLFSFTKSGVQNYSATISFQNGANDITLSRDILVSDEVCENCPILAEDGSNPDRAPASNESPVGCGNVGHGQTVSIGQIVTSEVVSCGEGAGNKVLTHTQSENRLCLFGSMLPTQNGDKTLLSEGACHSWIKTETTQCTAACGGQQSDVFSCLINSTGDGAVVSGDLRLCGEQPSSEPYVCDGDPDFEEIKVTEVLEKGEATVCHSNKQGYVIDKEVTQELYRCVDHKITLINSVTTVEEAPFCLDLKRCNDDSLSPSKAHGRLNWMNQCAAEQPKIQDFFDVTADYESAPQNSYRISDDGKKIVGRPTYVTFRFDEGGVWEAPAPGISNWKNKSAEHSDASGLSCEIPESAEIVGICLSSCVTPAQIIASGNGSALPIKRAYDQMLGNVQTLAPFSTILKPILMSTPVKQFITEVDDSEHDIMIFTMASGGMIEYTPNHPVVTADGNLKDAADFVIGQSFVKKNGDLDEIVKIENVKHFGKVYNVYMQSSVVERNVIVVNDYLTGSAYFQNEGHDFVDRQILRRSLSK